MKKMSTVFTFKLPTPVAATLMDAEKQQADAVGFFTKLKEFKKEAIVTANHNPELTVGHVKIM